MDKRKLVLKRTDNKAKALVLHDAQTGEILVGQQSLQVIQEPNELTRIVVTFVADKRSSDRVDIQCDDARSDD